jgi:hypothetical protein
MPHTIIIRQLVLFRNADAQPSRALNLHTSKRIE